LVIPIIWIYRKKNKSPLAPLAARLAGADSLKGGTEDKHWLFRAKAGIQRYSRVNTMLQKILYSNSLFTPTFILLPQGGLKTSIRHPGENRDPATIIFHFRV
jgi:hypothetical protein